jgi:hypothetical protein
MVDALHQYSSDCMTKDEAIQTKLMACIQRRVVKAIPEATHITMQVQYWTWGSDISIAVWSKDKIIVMLTSERSRNPRVVSDNAIRAYKELAKR